MLAGYSVHVLVFALDFFFTQILKLSVLILTDVRFFTLLTAKAIFASVIVSPVLLWEHSKQACAWANRTTKNYVVFSMCLIHVSNQETFIAVVKKRSVFVFGLVPDERLEKTLEFETSTSLFAGGGPDFLFQEGGTALWITLREHDFSNLLGHILIFF